VESRNWTLGDVFVLRHAGFPFDWLEGLGVSAGVLEEVGRSIETGSPSDLEQAQVAYEADRRRLRGRLQELARHPKVQEAVFLSSPDMYENVWERYVNSNSASDNSASRRVERQIYAYLQRLCAKNETTSFFGPMGQGEVSGEDDAIAFVPAEVRRRTSIAYWAVEALASRAAAEREIWRELPIRRNPMFVIDRAAREARCDSLPRIVPLSSAQMGLLDAVDRFERAEDIASARGESLVVVEDVAMSLFQAGVLVRRLWFPSDVADTLGGLRSAVAALSRTPARERWLSDISRLDSLRAAFELADLQERRGLLRKMEGLFVELAGVPARRAGGRLYTDRLIINEEVSSPFRLRMGRRFAKVLESALSPLLELCAAQGDRYQRRCVEAVRERLGCDGEVSFPSYAAALRDLQVEQPVGPEVEAGAGPVAQLSATILGTSAEGPRFALPDICLARKADGRLQPILARMHHQLLTRGWLFTFSSEPDRVDRLAKEWLREAAVPLVELATGRHNKGYYSFPGPRVAHATAELLSRGYPVLAAADLNVSLGGQGPRLAAADGTPLLLYLPLADLTLHPPFAALAHAPVVKATLRAKGPHSPRLDVETANYQRERWELSLASWGKRTGFGLFQAMQREKRRLRLPRFLFARVAGERKPFLVDTDCPFSVDLLRHHCPSGTVALEEMLPGPQDLWLRDERGRYTFELRMQAGRRG